MEARGACADCAANRARLAVWVGMTHYINTRRWTVCKRRCNVGETSKLGKSILQRLRKRTSQTVLIVISVLFLQSCVTPIEKIVVRQNADVGVLFLFDERPKHIHFGSTVFSNFEKSEIDDWNTKSELATRVNKILTSETNLTVKEIETPEKLKGKAKKGSGFWAGRNYRSEILEELEGIAQQERIDYLIAIVPLDIDFYPSPGQANGYGVYSNCLLGNCSIRAFSHIALQVYEANPPRYVGGRHEGVVPPLWKPHSKNVKALSEADLTQARDNFFQHKNDWITEVLQSTGLLQ